MSGRKKYRNTKPDDGAWDRVAWAKLYVDFYPQVRSWLVARLGHERDVDDLTEEVFTRLADSSMPKNRGVHIASLTLNVLRRYRRRRAKEQATLRKLVTRAIGAGAAKPEHGEPLDGEEFDSETRTTIKKISNELSREDRKLLRLRFEEDLRARQIALRVGCSTEAAKKRLQRIIQQLRVRCGVDPTPSKKS